MQAQHEQWKYGDGAKVWCGKYRNSQNLPHWHYDCEMICVEQGSLALFCGGQTYTLSQGAAALVGSEQVHFLHALSPQTIVQQIIFDYNILHSFAGELSLACPVLSRDYGLPQVYAAVRAELKDKKLFFAANAACTVIQAVIRILRGERCVPREQIASLERLKPLLEHIRDRYEFFGLDAAAAFMNMNPTYFSTLFHKLMGMTFSQYMNYTKVECALRLLRERKDLSMTEISIRCGFETIRNFNRIFKQYTGFAPRDLPDGFLLTSGVRSSSEEQGVDPTLSGCELLESSED